MTIGNLDLSIIEADMLDRIGLSMYAVHSKDGMTYAFYWSSSGNVCCNDLTEDQAQGILEMLLFIVE